MMERRILIIDDDLALTRVLRDSLTGEGYRVESVALGSAAINAAREFGPDLILLDVMLPDRSGFELCSALRSVGATPIIILSARSQKADKLTGLNLGIEDYITKPFDLQELFARIRIVLRRTQAPIDHLTLGKVTIDFRTLTAKRGMRSIVLSPREFDLLRYLAEHQNRAVYRDELLREIWGYVTTPTTRSVDHAIARLRRKIEPNPDEPTFIHTVFGEGYRLTPDAGSRRASEGAATHVEKTSHG